MRRALLAVPALALLAALAPATAAAAQEPPSRIQLCAATDIAAVDDLLAQVAEDELVGRLAPLASLTVPRDPDGVVLDAAVQLDDVRTALDCDQAPEPTPTLTPTASATAEPTSQAPAPTGSPSPSTTFVLPPASGSGFSQLDQVPTGAAETGGGPA